MIARQRYETKQRKEIGPTEEQAKLCSEQRYLTTFWYCYALVCMLSCIGFEFWMHQRVICHPLHLMKEAAAVLSHCPLSQTNKQAKIISMYRTMAGQTGPIVPNAFHFSEKSSVLVLVQINHYPLPSGANFQWSKKESLLWHQKRLPCCPSQLVALLSRIWGVRGSRMRS